MIRVFNQNYFIKSFDTKEEAIKYLAKKQRKNEERKYTFYFVDPIIAGVTTEEIIIIRD